LGGGLGDDFEALEAGWEEALGGFVEFFAGAFAILVGDDFLRLVEMLEGEAAGFVQALVLDAVLEAVAGGEIGGVGTCSTAGQASSGTHLIPGGMEPFFDAADDLGDAGLGQFVFFGEVDLALAGLIVEVDLLIAGAGGLEGAGLADAGCVFWRAGHDGIPLQNLGQMVHLYRLAQDE